MWGERSAGRAQHAGTPSTVCVGRGGGVARGAATALRSGGVVLRIVTAALTHALLLRPCVPCPPPPLHLHTRRGFETCTIMLEGQMKHEDSAGNKVGQLLH